jgi:hypothetical protein
VTALGTTTTGKIDIEWTVLPNEHGGCVLWFGAWLVGDEGGEGRWFYSGRGGEQSRLVPPPEATGMRILRWPHDGLDPEYVDLLFDDGRLPAPISTADLNFDVPQPHSRLPAEQ